MADKSNSIDFAKQLTGNFATDLSDAVPGHINAEIESDEWVLYPNGNLQKGYGEKHSSGGISTVLPDGTRILTDSIKIGNDKSKELSKRFDVTLSPKDTFSNALTKYAKKVGLTKTVDDQEAYFTQLQKLEQKDNLDNDTYLINSQYLSSKIKDAEDIKNALQTKVSAMFSALYDHQEDVKSDNPEKYESKTQKMEFGGISHNDLKIVADRMGISLDRAKEIAGIGIKPKYVFALGGESFSRMFDVPIFEGGGDIDKIRELQKQSALNQISDVDYVNAMKALDKDYDPSLDHFYNVKLSGVEIKPEDFYSSFSKDRGYQTSDVKHQSFTNLGSGRVQSKEDLIQSLSEMKRNFPLAWEKSSNGLSPEEVVNGIDGKPPLYNASNRGKEFIGTIQKNILDEQKNIVNFVGDNPNMFSGEYKKYINNYNNNETFLDTPNNVRSLDQKHGDFTASRFAPGVPIVTPEELKLANDNGLTTVPQLLNNKELFDTLSPETQKRLKMLDRGDKTPAFLLEQVTPETPSLQSTPPQEPAQPNPQGRIVYNVRDTRAKGPVDTYYPYYLPPSIPLQPQLAQQVDLGRIDPYRVRYEEDHQALNRGIKSVERSGMTPQQQSAAIASMVGNQQNADMQGQLAAVQNTFRNYQQADQQNLQLANQEQIQNKNLQRQYFDEISNSLNAKRLNDTEKNLDMHKQALEHYNQNRMNAIYGQLFDYNPGYFNTVKFDPNGDYRVSDSVAKRNEALSLLKAQITDNQ